MSNKGVCIITGASRGIGAATAKLAGKHGYKVAVNYARSRAAAEAVVRDIEARGGTAVAIQADVGVPEDIVRLFETTAAQLGAPTALVNNAAEPGERQAIEQINPSMIRRVLAVNLEGPILCTAQAVKYMSTAGGGGGGAIVNISSQAIRTGGYRLTSYVGSKAGVEAVTGALARELGPVGIRINAVCPGIIATEAAPLVDAAGNSRAKDIPLGRLGAVDEIAEAILWLLSPAASYVTGAVIPVTGGR